MTATPPQSEVPLYAEAPLWSITYPVMELRDVFAAFAMLAEWGHTTEYSALASKSYALADRMMQERDTDPEQEAT